MAEKFILHMVTPLNQMSPFDVNMAIDAGCDAVIPYTNVSLEEISGLVQDAIFSRPPKTGARTGMFFGGKNAILALDMIEAAKKALVPPFALSLFADPAGSFTTAAALVACMEKTLREKRSRALRGLKIAVFGATGVVGFSAGVIAALEGAEVVLVGYDGIRRVADAAREIKARFGIDVKSADGSDEAKKAAILAASEAALSAGRAGVRMLSKAQVEAAPNLLVVADVNAVPLSSAGALGIGPLAIGSIKYKTEFGLFQRMMSATKPVHFDFRDAFAL